MSKASTLPCRRPIWQQFITATKQVSSVFYDKKNTVAELKTWSCFASHLRGRPRERPGTIRRRGTSCPTEWRARRTPTTPTGRAVTDGETIFSTGWIGAESKRCLLYRHFTILGNKWIMVARLHRGTPRTESSRSHLLHHVPTELATLSDLSTPWPI